jgi:outer membrane immunogenic protein
MKRLLLAVAVLAFTGFAAHADGLPFKASRIAQADDPAPDINWSGVYIGGGVGGQAAITRLDAELGRSTASLNNLGAQDWIVNGRLGLDMRIPNSAFIFGVFGEYNWGDSTASLNVNDMNLAQLSLRPTWGAGARVGWLLNPLTMGYIGYKYSRADLDVRSGVKDLCSVPGLNCSQELVGHSALAGVEWKVASKLTGAVEYSYTRYDSATIFRSEESTITARPDNHTVMFRLNWRPFGN